MNEQKGKSVLGKQRCFVLLLLLCSVIYSFGQVTVKGKVLDESEEPVIGASILVKGTTNGTITDVNGMFQLKVKNTQEAVLEVSYIGYESQSVAVKGRQFITVNLAETSNLLNEVTVVAYGTQNKKTLTGAVASVKTDALLASPNASIANSLAGKIAGLSSVQSSGQPGAEDPKLFVRGIGSLSEGGASPLILVDGVERSFFQMDPNEIEDITVLKDASATAVFGVRGANGVILVTTRRGEEGKASISVSSSVGFQTPTRMLEMADSYTYAMAYNEMQRNDGTPEELWVFDAYKLERFRTGDTPILYPNIKWREYMMKDAALQTQHNLNISGGTKNVRYFISLGYLFQDGLFKDFGKDELGYKYNRYNYRANLDLDLTPSTLMKLNIGGVVGDKHQPAKHSALWEGINWAQPFSSPGIIDGKLVNSANKYDKVILVNPLNSYYNAGYRQSVTNTMNLDLSITQKLDFITKGLSMEAKGAYNTDYTYTKIRGGDYGGYGGETYTAYYQSELENPGMDYNDPDFNKEIVYVIEGQEGKLNFSEETGRGRNWYFEASVRYNRKFGDHNVGALLLYNQHKKYYPSQYTYLPTAYVGLVGRVTYDYKSRYLAEFNIGYNGSENFAPDQRFGTFPAFSLGYILSEEKFMKKQKVIDFLKLRASVGLVGNDNMSGNRYLYLPDAYNVDLLKDDGTWGTPMWGYNFGLNNGTPIKGSVEKRLGNKNVTWETSLKQNYGVDMNFFGNRLKTKFDIFFEDRKDILIARKTIPLMTSLTDKLLPVVNMGEVKNKGYEIEVGWADKLNSAFDYYINANMSYSKNKIIYQDEVEPNEPYLWRTGKQVGAVFGYVADGFYSDDDFVDGKLKEGLPVPSANVAPGDAKYRDLNNDGVIDPDDQMNIGFSTTPNYTFGLNLGASYKGFFFSMNWTGTAERSLLMSEDFRNPFNGDTRSLMQHLVDHRWTPETAATATQPRFATSTGAHNIMTSNIWLRDGSYIKLKNLTLGYNFTDYPVLKKIGIKQLGVKFTAYNLLTFDHFGIMDPESNPSRYTDTYPVVKIFNFGVDIKF